MTTDDAQDTSMEEESLVAELLSSAPFSRKIADKGGMSLREWFAGQALSGLPFQVDHTESGYPTSCWQEPEEKDAIILARISFRIADAMIVGREQAKE